MLTRSKKDFLDFALAQKTALPDYDVAPARATAIPFPETKVSQPFFACGCSFVLTHRTDPKKRHTVTVMLSRISGRAEPEFHFACGDGYLQGTNDGGKTTAMERVDRALDEAGAKGNAKMRKLMEDSFSIFPADSDCGFWKKLRSSPDSCGCKHVSGLFAKITQPELEAALSAAETAYTEASTPGKAPARKVVAEEALLTTLRTLLKPSSKTKFPVLIEGEKGGGKTTAVRDLGTNDYEHFEEAQGASGMESFDFLGGTVPLPGGGYVWVDGPVTRAFRLAASGKKVLLCVDEIFRVPRRERDIFMSALSPYKGSYRLRSGRPVNVTDGVAEMEMIEAPVEHLAVTATANNGSEYDGEASDPAGAERWHMLIHTPSPGFIEAVLRKEAKAHKLAISNFAPLLKFRNSCEKLKADRHCAAVPSGRLLIRAMAIAGTDSQLQTGVEALIPNLVGRTPEGRAIPEQVEAVKLAIKHAFAA